MRSPYKPKIHKFECVSLATGIPQVVVLTKVDETSPQVAEDITVVYRSKAIRLKVIFVCVCVREFLCVLQCT